MCETDQRDRGELFPGFRQRLDVGHKHNSGDVHMTPPQVIRFIEICANLFRRRRTDRPRQLLASSRTPGIHDEESASIEPMEHHHFYLKNVDDQTVVKFTVYKLADEDIVETISEKLRAQVLRGQFGRLVLDFTGVRVLSPRVAWKLASDLARLTHCMGGALAARNVHPAIREILEETREVFGKYGFQLEDDNPDDNLGGVCSPLKPMPPCDHESAAKSPESDFD